MTNELVDKTIDFGKREDDQMTRVSVPSDLSEGVWGELPKFNYIKYQENLKKEKEAQKRKRD